ncbi:Uncharacterised protein [Alysiella crassa]|uniref:Uncharacterized protein n=1 Tax=Alysiella crassa TaxID=153491 RepID=A0A376BLV7_9NEIS|nr:Uncharacterised protein [Alysiella crassa]
MGFQAALKLAFLHSIKHNRIFIDYFNYIMNQPAFHILDFRPEQFADGWVFTELAQLIHYSLLELGYASEIGDRLSRIQPTQRPIFLVCTCVRRTFCLNCPAIPLCLIRNS